MAFMPEEMLDPGGPGGAGLGGVAARLDGMLEDRLRGLPTGRNTNRSCWRGQRGRVKEHLLHRKKALSTLNCEHSNVLLMYVIFF